MATLHVMNLDDKLYEALVARAAMDHRSVGQEVATMIREFIARPASDPRAATRQLMELAGSWVDE